MLQSSHPIALASKILNDIETHYAIIECECLSVYFSLERFHTYIYGRHVIVENDHKLVEMIQQKPIHVAPSQLQYMLLHMQMYDYTIWYKPGKDMVQANCLSCFPSHVNSLLIPIPTMPSMYSCQMLNWTLFEALWNVTQCIASPITSPLEVGQINGRKFPTLPDISGEPGMNCLLIQAYSLRGQESAFPQSCSTAPLLICMVHIRGLIGCRPR